MNIYVKAASVALIYTTSFSMNLHAETKLDHKVSFPVVAEQAYEVGKYVEVKGSKIHYKEAGKGDPILFIHGNPTSAYLWRNITPFLQEQGRTIAIDLIGMGKSGKPNIQYSYQEHAEYLNGFIDALNLKNITLVTHDWGSALGFDYASRHPENVKAISFMEGVLPPLFPQESFTAMGPEIGEMFRQIKTSGTGEEMIIKNNMFVEEILPNMISRPLGESAMNVYRAPFIKEETRTPILQWPREVPIAGEPIESVELMTRIDSYMRESNTPMLVLYAHPGVITPAKLIPHYIQTINNLETSYVGEGLHFIQEDQPDAIGREISDWYRRLTK